MKLNKLQPHINGIINAIIETPRHSQNKYNYDPSLKLFKLKKTLPLGMSFPFDFGFIPNTRGGDGAPLDVLVMMEGSAWPGCLIECRPLAILNASQHEPDMREVLNDRIIAIALTSQLYKDVTTLSQLSGTLTKQIEDFFIGYNKAEGKTFIPLGWGHAGDAIALIERSQD